MLQYSSERRVPGSNTTTVATKDKPVDRQPARRDLVAPADDNKVVQTHLDLDAVRKLFMEAGPEVQRRMDLAWSKPAWEQVLANYHPDQSD